MNVNKVIIVGRLTRDPEKKVIPSGQTVTNFSVATSRKWKNQDGSDGEKTEFHNVVAWGRRGEVIAQYMTKGQEIFLEGRLETRNWDDPESGKKMYRTEIIMEDFQFGAKPAGAAQGNYQNQQPASPAPAPATDTNPNPTPAQAPAQEEVNIPAAEEIPTIDVDADTEEIKVEDIPF